MSAYRWLACSGHYHVLLIPDAFPVVRATSTEMTDVPYM